MKQIITIVIFINFLTISLLSQSNEIFIEQIGTGNTAEIYQEKHSSDNLIQLSQIGDWNKAILFQQASVGLGQNTLELYQIGLSNVLVASQVGFGNYSSVTQSGNDNFYELTLTGNYNDITALQSGSGNTVIQELNGSNYKIDIKQLGNENSIIHIDNHSSIPQMTIIQSGTRARLMLVNGVIGR